MDERDPDRSEASRVITTVLAQPSSRRAIHPCDSDIVDVVTTDVFGRRPGTVKRPT